jgi:hypothetical protein
LLQLIPLAGGVLIREPSAAFTKNQDTIRSPEWAMNDYTCRSAVENLFSARVPRA